MNLNRRLTLLLTLCAAFALVRGSAEADAKPKPKYIYLVSEVKSADSVTGSPITEIRAGLDKGLAKTPEISAALPKGAPDPVKQPKEFKRFLKRKKLRAFRVNVEITSYEQRTEKLERGNRVSVHVDLRLFGETLPERVMAFAGQGSATVKLDVGKRVRDADRKAANGEAIEVAIKEALAESLKKLGAPKRKKKRAKK